MCDGLDITLNLGRHWRNYFVAFAALIPYLCFGQFSSNDSANLENIAYYISYLQSNHSELSDISSKLGTFDYLQDFADDSVTLLNSIATTLSSLQPGVIGPKIESVRTAIEDVGDQVYYMRQDFKQAQRIETNLISRGFADIVDSLETWGYSISNALGNLEFPIGSTFTNRYAQLYPQAYKISDFDNGIVSQYFQYYYGYTPSSAELSTFKSLIGRLSVYELAQSMITLVPKDILTGSPLAWYNNLNSGLGNIGVNSSSQSAIKAIGSARYFAYGTRDLTAISHGISNTVSKIEKNTTNLLALFASYYEKATNEYPVAGDTIYGTGTNSTFSSSFVGAVGGLAESFTHSSSVDDNVSNVDTNPIVNIENQGYNSKLAQVTAANMQDTSQIAGIADAVANIQNEYQSLIGINSSAQQYILDFGTVGAFGTSKAVSFTLSRPSSQMYWHAQDFFFAVLKAIALLTTVYSIYVHIAAETEV